MDDSATLSHTMPRPIELFAPRSSPAYAFATLFSASPDECVPQLLSCLPAKPELLEYMDTFEQCVSAQMPVQLSRNEVERFLADARANSQSCPAMLALLLAVIALGAQHAIWDRNGEADAAKMETEAQKGNVYSKLAKALIIKAYIMSSHCSNAGIAIGLVLAQAISDSYPSTHLARKILDQQWTLPRCLYTFRRYY